MTHRSNNLPDPPAPWKKGCFLIASNLDFVLAKDGYVSAHLNINPHKYTARYRRKDGTRRVDWVFVFTHANTGHAIATMESTSLDALWQCAAELLTITDWSFVGLDGWKNLDPELPHKISAMKIDFPELTRGRIGFRNEVAARMVAASR